MNLSPEMIDAAVIQLRAIFEHAENIPANVRDSGKIFLDALDTWSEEMKKVASLEVK
jgi:hypothetical protein